MVNQRLCRLILGMCFLALLTVGSGAAVAEAVAPVPVVEGLAVPAPEGPLCLSDFNPGEAPLGAELRIKETTIPCLKTCSSSIECSGWPLGCENAVICRNGCCDSCI